MNSNGSSWKGADTSNKRESNGFVQHFGCPAFWWRANDWSGWWSSVIHQHINITWRLAPLPKWLTECTKILVNNMVATLQHVWGEFGGSEAKKEAGASTTHFSGTTGFGKGFMYQSCSVSKCVIDAVTPTVTVVMLLRSNNNNIYFPGWKPW